MEGESNLDSEPMFPKLDADSDEHGVTEIESLCLHCHEQGCTRLMLTKIPFFKEVIISSFTCDHCGFTDTGIQSAGSLQEKGIKINLNVTRPEDLNRQVVKSDTATFAIPHLGFEQPPVNRKGEITTIEGLIDGVVNGLQMLQPERKAADAEMAKKVDDFIDQMKQLKTVKTHFQIVIDDPSGNSFIENFNAPNVDEHMKIEHYTRTRQQEIDMGYVAEDDEVAEEQKEAEPENLKDEVLVFKTNCSNCSRPCDTNMKLVDIPFFKQVVIMCTICDSCGTKHNEVKAGAGIEPKGMKYTLKITDPTDLSRDVLKSDTCGVSIPELELELMEGTLGGKFTTLEGLITDIVNQLSETSPVMIGMVGDSSQDDRKVKMNKLIEKLQQVAKGEMMNVHLILDDPAGNSYLQNVYAPDPDPEMTVEQYDRTDEQNDDLGIKDMKTENYYDDDNENKDNVSAQQS